MLSRFVKFVMLGKILLESCCAKNSLLWMDDIVPVVSKSFKAVWTIILGKLQSRVEIWFA